MKDEDYLDEKFPKGETKFRGEAIVLLALARQVGKQEVQEEELISLINILNTNDRFRIGEIELRIKQLKENSGGKGEE